MQTPDFPAAVPPEMLELSASRQTWYVGRHTASHRMYWVYTPVGYQVAPPCLSHGLARLRATLLQPSHGHRL